MKNKKCDSCEFNTPKWLMYCVRCKHFYINQDDKLEDLYKKKEEHK